MQKLNVWNIVEIFVGVFAALFVFFVFFASYLGSFLN